MPTFSDHLARHCCVEVIKVSLANALGQGVVASLETPNTVRFRGGIATWYGEVAEGHGLGGVLTSRVYDCMMPLEFGIIHKNIWSSHVRHD